jgi:hypothetical protein
LATDPVRRVRERTHDLPLTFGVREALVRLAALPPSPAVPYVTVTLDWRPEGSDPGREPAPELRRSERRARRGEVGASRRPSRQEIDRQLAQVLAEHGPRGEAFDSLSADALRIAAFLNGELDPAAQGVYIVACAAHEVFEPLTFALPLPTRLAVGPTPALSPLALLVDDHPAYAVLVADQRNATLSMIRRAARGRSVWLESNLYPRKQQQGGWSQRRFQARADERVAAFAREIATETKRALNEAEIDTFILAGDEVITSALDAAFSPDVSERLVTTIRLDIDASEQEVIAATLPLAAQAERDRELAAVRALVSAHGADGRGAAGAPAVLRALQAGQVATLLLTDDFASPGWADYGREIYGVGATPTVHPLAGNETDLVAVDLVEEMMRLAVRTGATIDIVHSAAPAGEGEEPAVPQAGTRPPRSEAAALLDQLGGVGALLRFTVEPS